MIRLFAALPIPFDIAEGLLRRQQGLPGAQWRSDEVLHITLRFYGEVSTQIAEDLDGVLAGISLAPFDLHLEGAGAFGDADRMRAVWAGVGESEPLRRLAAKCDSAARRVGMQAETRAYRPHVTLAYLKGSPADRVNAWVAEHNLLKSPAWRVSQFHLYSSLLSADGSRYEVERTYPLV